MSRIFQIDSETVTVYPDWNIQDSINSRTIVQFTVSELGNLTEINIGDEIKITEEAEVIFKGTVDSAEEYEPDPGFLEYRVTGVDFSALADKRLIADSFVETTAGDIIRSFVTNTLSEEGVSSGDIEGGPTLQSAVFNYDTAAASLDYLRDLSGLNWNIDFDKALNFFDRSENVAPWTLDDTVQHVNFRRTRTRDQYRNRQYIRAGKGESAEQELEVPTPAPDGKSRNFVVRFPLAKKPRIFVNSIEVDASDIGVNGLDTNKKFYFSYQSNVVSQDPAETVLISTDEIEITYTGLVPIRIVADDPAQIEERKNKETGTSGIYEHQTKETNIDQSSAAIEFAQGLLQKYGIIPSIVTFETEVHGLRAGQLLPIEKTLYGIDGTYLIESVNVFVNGQDTVYAVKCLDGSALGGWEEFFKDLIKGGRDFVIQSNEVLIILVTAFEQQNWTEATTPSVFACPIAGYGEEDLVSNNMVMDDGPFPSETLYPC